MSFSLSDRVTEQWEEIETLANGSDPTSAFELAKRLALSHPSNQLQTVSAMVGIRALPGLAGDEAGRLDAYQTLIQVSREAGTVLPLRREALAALFGFRSKYYPGEPPLFWTDYLTDDIVLGEPGRSRQVTRFNLLDHHLRSEALADPGLLQWVRDASSGAYGRELRDMGLMACASSRRPEDVKILEGALHSPFTREWQLAAGGLALVGPTNPSTWEGVLTVLRTGADACSQYRILDAMEKTQPRLGTEESTALIQAAISASGGGDAQGSILYGSVVDTLAEYIRSPRATGQEEKTQRALAKASLMEILPLVATFRGEPSYILLADAIRASRDADLSEELLSALEKCPPGDKRDKAIRWIRDGKE